MKTRLIILICIATVFFSSMLFLTFNAKKIKNSSLPQVTAEQLEKKMFVIDGNSVKCYALPGKIRSQRGNYIIVSEEVNGDECYFARKITFETGAAEDGFYPVTGDSYNGEPVVISSDRALFDGREVFLIQVQAGHNARHD